MVASCDSCVPLFVRDFNRNSTAAWVWLGRRPMVMQACGSLFFVIAVCIAGKYLLHPSKPRAFLLHVKEEKVKEMTTRRCQTPPPKKKGGFGLRGSKNRFVRDPGAFFWC